MEFTGRIIKVLDQRGGVSSRTGNPWKMQDFVIEETIGQFPKRMVFNVFGEENLDINAREYNGRWYNDVRVWNVVAAAPAQPVATAQPAVQPAAPFPPAEQAPAPAQTAFEAAPDESSDLPF